MDRMNCGVFFVIFSIVFLLLLSISGSLANLHAKKLYDDLLKSSDYNKLVRPVGNNSDTLTVYLGLKLSQLIDVDERNQIMTTNVWLLQRWRDYKLTWDPEKYGGVKVLYVPAEEIWLPDIVLYNNADGDYVVTIMTKATVSYDGIVNWNPPAVYKSSCEIDVEFFPFDQQSCHMKFGSWSYDGFKLDLKHILQIKKNRHEREIDFEFGISLDTFEESFEWDVLGVPATRKDSYYPCCMEPIPDITFNITLRRKPLFYTVNLIIPCVVISFLTVFVFCVPSDSREKVGLSIYIMVSLNVFFLVLVDITPPTSFVVPLMGKYLLFTMIVVVLSIMSTVIVLNDHFRSSSTHEMPSWVRQVFLHIMPRLLFMKRPERYTKDQKEKKRQRKREQRMRDGRLDTRSHIRDIYDSLPEQVLGDYTRRRIEDHTRCAYASHNTATFEESSGNLGCLDGPSCPEVDEMLDQVHFLSEHMKKEDEDNDIREDWKFVAMVLDRLFFWLFTTSCLVGTFGIILQAPMIYDKRPPLGNGDLDSRWCGNTVCNSEGQIVDDIMKEAFGLDGGQFGEDILGQDGMMMIP